MEDQLLCGAYTQYLFSGQCKLNVDDTRNQKVLVSIPQKIFPAQILEIKRAFTL